MLFIVEMLNNVNDTDNNFFVFAKRHHIAYDDKSFRNIFDLAVLVCYLELNFSFKLSLTNVEFKLLFFDFIITTHSR